MWRRMNKFQSIVRNYSRYELTWLGLLGYRIDKEDHNFWVGDDFAIYVGLSYKNPNQRLMGQIFVEPNRDVMNGQTEFALPDRASLVCLYREFGGHNSVIDVLQKPITSVQELNTALDAMAIILAALSPHITNIEKTKTIILKHNGHAGYAYEETD